MLRANVKNISLGLLFYMQACVFVNCWSLVGVSLREMVVTTETKPYEM